MAKENVVIVFENADWYKKDADKEAEYDGILRKIYHDDWPALGGIGPQITTFYKLDTVNAPQLPIKEYILNTQNTTNHELDKYLGWQVKTNGKLTNNELAIGWLIPVARVEAGERIEVAAKDDWYKQDTDQVQDFTGKLSKIPPLNIPPGGGPGPVVTHFYQLKLKQFLPTQPSTTYTLFTNGKHIHVLDKYSEDQNDVRITGKLTNNQLYPGYLTPLYDAINPGGPIIPSTQPGGPIISAPVQYVVFADEPWYQSTADKVQSWTGKLIQHLSPQVPPGSGVGPVVTHFYELEFSFLRIFHPAKVINSNNSRNPILDQFLNQEVRLVGKLANNEIIPGYLIPVGPIHIPLGPGPVVPPGTTTGSGSGSGTTAPGGTNTNIVEPIIVVLANTEFYKKDEDRVQNWVGTLQKFTPTTPLPPPGTTHFVPVIYQLHLYFAPPIILEETLPLNTEGKHNDVLDQHLNQRVSITGKLSDGQIIPGYLSPVIITPPGTVSH